LRSVVTLLLTGLVAACAPEGDVTGPTNKCATNLYRKDCSSMKSLRIARRPFLNAYESSPGVRRMIHVANEMLVEKIQQVAACHALHHAEGRLARRLLQSHDYAGNDILDLTQDFVSEMIGVRRTTVTTLYTTYRSGNCDARKADVGSQSADPIKFCFRSQGWPVLKWRVARETGPARGRLRRSRSAALSGGEAHPTIPRGRPAFVPDQTGLI
jgi:hypothetical protein